MILSNWNEYMRYPLLKTVIVYLMVQLPVAVVAQNSIVPQDSISPVVWNLQQCLDYAMKYNIQLNTLRLTHASTEQDLILSKAAKLPNLTGSATQNFNGGQNLNNAYTVNGAGNYSVNSSMTIYNGGFLNKDIQQKQLLTKVAGLNVDQQMNSITLLITQDYLSVLLAKENIVYLKDLVTTAEAQVTQAQQQYDVGSIALVALIELKATLANDKYLLVTAENTRRQNLLNLKQILLLPTSKPFDIVSPDTLMGVGLLTPVEMAQKEALDTRPEVKSSSLGVDVSNLDLAKARTGYLPVLTAGGSVGSSYLTGNDIGYFKQLDNNFYQQLGVTLSVPIFTRKQNKVNVEKAKIEVQESQLNLQNTKTVLSQQVEQAYIAVLNAQSQYDAAAEQFKYTQEAYRISSEQLKIGAANIVDFLQQKNLYIQALQSYIQAKYTAALNIRIYDFYRGVPVQL